jgi:DNA-binding MarR family transcriptional regulator
MSDIYDPESYHPLKSLGYLIGRVRSELLAMLDAKLALSSPLASLELSATQLIIIVTLAMAEKSLSVADLCKRIWYDAGAMTRMLDRLESKGLISRHRVLSDRRLIRVELTEEGWAVFPRVRAVSMGVLNQALRGFTRAEALQLESYLTRMLANAQWISN